MAVVYENTSTPWNPRCRAPLGHAEPAQRRGLDVKRGSPSRLRMLAGLLPAPSPTSIIPQTAARRIAQAARVEHLDLWSCKEINHFLRERPPRPGAWRGLS